MSTAISSVKREGTTTYDPRVLEANWYEERSRQEVGEKVYLELMDGAVIAPLDPDLSIAPPTRVPGVPSNGKLMIPDRMTRSRTTQDSSRQGADDGFREYLSMNQTMYKPIEAREKCPISTEANYHGTWGGPIQIDDLDKTRISAKNREKNTQLETDLVKDGEKKAAKKFIGMDTWAHISAERPSAGLGIPGGFGSILQRNPAGASVRMLESTAMASWK